MHPNYTNQRNKKAEYALISTISSFIFGFTALAGIVLGILALKEIKTTGEKGKVMAWFAIGIPLAQIAVAVFLILLLSGVFGGGKLTF